MAAEQDVALELIRARARELWEPPVAEVWLTSPNAHLGGATPISVVRTRGPEEVLATLDAARAGAY
jgi:hypothetical protein